MTDVVREHIRNVNWGLWGEELKPWQAIQRLVIAGFHDPRVVINMFAIIEGESGSYTKAWHANVLRNTDGTILRDADGRMTVNSIDLGFIQRNVNLAVPVKVDVTEEAMKVFVDGMFNKYPHLARADKSAEIAYELWLQRGYRPWYGYKPDTPEFKAKKQRGVKALAEYLVRTQIGKIDGKLPQLVWK